MDTPAPFTTADLSGAIDCDVHPGVPRRSDLMPYFGAYWRERIAYVTGEYGAYAEERILPAARAIALPDGLSDEAAASFILKGLTACMLLRRVYVVQRERRARAHLARNFGMSHAGNAVIGDLDFHPRSARVASRRCCAPLSRGSAQTLASESEPGITASASEELILPWRPGSSAATASVTSKRPCGRQFGFPNPCLGAAS